MRGAPFVCEHEIEGQSNATRHRLIRIQQFVTKSPRILAKLTFLASSDSFYRL